jgi:hypothetical protein
MGLMRRLAGGGKTPRPSEVELASNLDEARLQHVGRLAARFRPSASAT